MLNKLICNLNGGCIDFSHYGTDVLIKGCVNVEYVFIFQSNLWIGILDVFAFFMSGYSCTSEMDFGARSGQSLWTPSFFAGFPTVTNFSDAQFPYTAACVPVNLKVDLRREWTDTSCPIFTLHPIQVQSQDTNPHWLPTQKHANSVCWNKPGYF